MSTQYFKKDKGYIAWFVSVEPNQSGIDIMVDDSGEMASVKKSCCQVVIAGFEPCTEKEFNVALDRAMIAINQNTLVAA